MPNAIATTRLTALDKALEAASATITLVMRVPPQLKPLADQVIRPASSAPANLAEGHGRSETDRMHMWWIARASAKEVNSHLRPPTHAGVIEPAFSRPVLVLFDEVTGAPSAP